MQKKLLDKAKSDKKNGIKALFEDKNRVAKYTYLLPNLALDLSKTHLDKTIIEQYQGLAEQRNFHQKKEGLFSGQQINITEKRSVLHTLLRNSDNQPNNIKPSTLEQAKQSHHDFKRILHTIHSDWMGSENPVTDIIHVGIGGSVLGPQLLYEVCKGLNNGIRIHFVSNIDAHQLVDILSQCKPKTSLVVGVSKTFTTAETLQNLNSIVEWFQSCNQQDYRSRVYAVTANPSQAEDYGIKPSNIVCFPDWVGGRYSVWSPVSISSATAIGYTQFKQFLSGAAEVDRYFYQTPVQENACFVSAALDHYYHNYLGAQSRAIFAYDFRLRSFVSYLQQLETESNGKDRQINGERTKDKTSSIIWGGVGTDAQHSVFQMLHQGSHLIPTEFILVKCPDHDLLDHHRELLSNGIAQSAALLSGQTLERVKQLNTGSVNDELALKAKVFQGDKPSSTLLLERLDAKTLGALLAFYEHRTFCLGVLCNINSYDQMGVELGKRLAKAVRPILQEQKKNLEEFDESTKALIRKIKG